MSTRLHVWNLPLATSVAALRTHFGVCGVVSDVQITRDRYAGRGRDSASVQMGSAAGAARAVSELNGSAFAGQLLRVEGAPDEPGDTRQRSKRQGGPSSSSPARITVQFRQPENMTYELDCAGVSMVLRVFFQNAAGQWRIAAQGSREADAPITMATAPVRTAALREIARACREGTGVAALRGLDWEAVEQALTNVRAL